MVCYLCAIIPNVVLDLKVRRQILIVKFISNKKAKATWKENTSLFKTHYRKLPIFQPGTDVQIL